MEGRRFEVEASGGSSIVSHLNTLGACSAVIAELAAAIILVAVADVVSAVGC